MAAGKAYQVVSSFYPVSSLAASGIPAASAAPDSETHTCLSSGVQVADVEMEEFDVNLPTNDVKFIVVTDGRRRHRCLQPSEYDRVCDDCARSKTGS